MLLNPGKLGATLSVLQPVATVLCEPRGKGLKVGLSSESLVPHAGDLVLSYSSYFVSLVLKDFREGRPLPFIEKQEYLKQIVLKREKRLGLFQQTELERN